MPCPAVTSCFPDHQCILPMCLHHSIEAWVHEYTPIVYGLHPKQWRSYTMGYLKHFRRSTSWILFRKKRSDCSTRPFHGEPYIGMTAKEHTQIFEGKKQGARKKMQGNTALHWHFSRCDWHVGLQAWQPESANKLLLGCLPSASLNHVGENYCRDETWDPIILDRSGTIRNYHSKKNQNNP